MAAACQIRIGELDRVEGVYHAFENRADRYLYFDAFDEIAAQSALADSGNELRRRLAKICRLAQETDTILTKLWFHHLNPTMRNGIAPKPLLVGWVPSDHSTGASCLDTAQMKKAQ